MNSESARALCSSLLLHLAEPAIRSLFLAAIAFAVLRFCRVRDASIRLAVWKAVLWSALAMPLLGWFLPALPLAVPDMTVPQKGGVSSEPSVVQNLEPAPALLPHVKPIDVIPQVPRKPSTIVWPMIAVTIYFLVAGFLLARFGLGFFLSARMRRYCRRTDDPHAQAFLEQLAQASGLRRAPELAESHAVAVPVTLGVLHPVILLPAAWGDWEERKLRVVVAHELSHVARRDALTQALAALHRCIFWFSPLSWWLERLLAELAEQASDDAALRTITDRTFYAEVLLVFLAAIESARGRIHWQGVSMAKGRSVHRRVDHILSAKEGLFQDLKKPVGLFILLATLPLVGLVAAVQPEIRQRAQDSIATTPRSHDSGLPDSALGIPSDSSGLAATAAAAQNPPAPASPSSRTAKPVPPSPAAAPAPAPAPHPTPPAVPAPAAQPVPVVGEDDESFMIVSGDSTTMSGSSGDEQHAKSLRKKIAGDFIWFRRDDKGYVIRDAAMVRQAKELFAPQEALGRQQEELGKKQEELGRQQEELGGKMQQVSVKVPDLTAEMKRLQDQLAQLRQAATQENLGRAQQALGELQARLGELQGKAGAEQGKLGAMHELGRRQGELGAQQGRLGEQQARLAQEAHRKMRSILDDALEKGLAQPE